MEEIHREAEKHLGLLHTIAASISRRYYINPLIEHGDLVGFGYFGLVRAVKRFDPTQGFRFSSYAYPCIEKAIVDGLRLMFKEQRLAAKRGEALYIDSLVTRPGKDGGHPESGEVFEDREEFGDRGADAEETVSNLNYRHLLQQLRAELKPQHYEVLYLMAEHKLSFEQISRLLGVDRRVIHQRHLKASRAAQYLLAHQSPKTKPKPHPNPNP
jgi:RNA polymerase sigma factor (sigma-70 family)